MPKPLGKRGELPMMRARVLTDYSTQCAYGEFEATADCSDITSASFLNKAGKKTLVLLRVSTVGPEAGSADTS